MKERTARTIVRVYGIIIWVIGLLMLETAFRFLKVDTAEVAQLIFVDERIVLFLLGAGGFFLVVFGFHVQQYRPWSRIAALIIGAVVLILGIYLMVRCDNACTTWLVSLPLNVFRILMGVFSIWFFSNEKSVVRLFTGQPQQAVKKK